FLFGTYPFDLHFVLISLCSGGIMLGAWFMATDYVTTPVTGAGQIVFGIGCGLLTFVIRRFGGYPEGTTYAILLMNIAAPLIDKLVRPRVFGEVKKRG
ncbi:MAG: RnfABCDGE type electron transport complex subunit D, partial [Clostridia bacterium]|nr:RnfABCDGE type electron transport complex subunit D [Clostridia bacterium]